MRKTRQKKIRQSRDGFTLLELLVVIAILAMIAGGMLVAYDGLEDSASAGHDAFNAAGIDRAIRTFRAMNRNYATGLDSLHNDPAAGAALLDRLDTGLSGRLIMSVVAAGEEIALSNVGITSVIDIDDDGGVPGPGVYDNDTDFTNDPFTSTVNRIFDPVAQGGVGMVRTPVAATDDVAIVDPAVSGGELHLKLGLTVADKVVAVGLGNNCGMIDATGATQGALATAPYSRVNPNRYGRFVLLFQVADLAGPLTDALFVGILDSQGRLSEEAFDAFQN